MPMMAVKLGGFFSVSSNVPITAHYFGVIKLKNRVLWVCILHLLLLALPFVEFSLTLASTVPGGLSLAVPRCLSLVLSGSGTSCSMLHML